MTDDKFYTSLPANNIMAKLTNHVQRTRLITPSTDKHYSLDSEDDFRSGCRNVSHQQQFFSELLSPGQSQNANYCCSLFLFRIYNYAKISIFKKYKLMLYPQKENVSYVYYTPTSPYNSHFPLSPRLPS